MFEESAGHLLRLEYVLKRTKWKTIYRASRWRKHKDEDQEPSPSPSGAETMEAELLSPPPRAPPTAPENGLLYSPLRSHAVMVKEIGLDDLVMSVSAFMDQVAFLTNAQHPNLVRTLSVFCNTGVHANAEGVQCTASAIAYGGPTRNASMVSLPVDGATAPLTLSQQPSLCVVEQLVEGCSVNDYIAKVCMPTQDRLRRQVGGGSGFNRNITGMKSASIAAILFDALRALRYLHEECHYVHRHVTTSALLIDKQNGKVKLGNLLDCGQVLNPQEGCRTLSGGLGYAAPEVLQWGTVDPDTGVVRTYAFAVDIWSLGIVALEMAMGIFASREANFVKHIELFANTPCSCEAGGAVTDGHLAADLMADNVLADFIACCLRFEQSVRPDARSLLAHPLFVKHRSDSLLDRSRSILGVVEAVELAQLEPAAANTTELPETTKRASTLTSASTPRTTAAGVFLNVDGTPLPTPERPPSTHEDESQLSSESHVPLGDAAAAVDVTLSPHQPPVISADDAGSRGGGDDEGRATAASASAAFTNDSTAERVEILKRAFYNARSGPTVLSESFPQFQWDLPPNLRYVDTWNNSASAREQSPESANDKGGLANFSRAPKTLFESVIHPAAGESLRTMQQMYRALRRMHPDTLKELQATGQVTFSTEDLRQTARNMKAVERTLNQMDKAFRKLASEDGEMVDLFCEHLVAQLISSRENVESLQSSALSLQTLLAHSNGGTALTTSGNGTAQRVVHATGEKTAATHSSQQSMSLPARMPVRREESGAGGKPEAVKGNASSFLYNQWLSKQS